jgi:hypothetical protein
MGKVRDQRQAKIKEKILIGLRRGWSRSGAARYGGLSYVQFLKWEANDPLFAAAVADAMEEGTDGLEDVATSRAKRKSDTLMMFMLGARRPDKYRPKREDGSPGNININIKKF